MEVIGERPEEFRVVGLAAGGSQVELLAQQVLDTEAAVVGITRATAVQDLQLALYAEAQRRGWAYGRTRLPRILAGPEAAAELAGLGCDVVLNCWARMDHMIGIAERLPAMSEVTAARLERALAGTGDAADGDRAHLIAKRDALLDLARNLA